MSSQGVKQSFASLTSEDGEYLQVAGGPGLFMLEHRLPNGSSFRAAQAAAVVPFEDGTILAFSAGEISLRRDEWFLIGQVVEAFSAFVVGRSLPNSIKWRELGASFVPVT